MSVSQAVSLVAYLTVAVKTRNNHYQVLGYQ